MDRILCAECGQCNRKGKPSVMRLSKYCNEHFKRTIQVKKRFGFLTNIKNKYFDKRFDEKKNKVENKGFRPSWFN